MRRVLVLLDGKKKVAKILSDARRLAGPDGVLLLAQDLTRVQYYEAWEQLQSLAHVLEAQGVSVRLFTLDFIDQVKGIKEAVERFDANIIVCCTHERTSFHGLTSGNGVWRTVAGSPVPVLIRHVEERDESSTAGEDPLERSILVPLDGSPLAEQALPLAKELAEEWDASIWLAQVVVPPLIRAQIHYQDREADEAAQAYLDEIAGKLSGKVHGEVLAGSVVGSLVNAVEAWNITDVVMSSHGRTALKRVVLGSVADALIHRLHLPIVVVPAHASRVARRVQDRIERAANPDLAQPTRA